MQLTTKFKSHHRTYLLNNYAFTSLSTVCFVNDILLYEWCSKNNMQFTTIHTCGQSTGTNKRGLFGQCGLC